MSDPVIYLAEPEAEEKALELCRSLGFSLSCDSDLPIQPALIYRVDGLSLTFIEGKNRIETRADFVAGSVAHRLNFGGGKNQSIAKAVGLNKRRSLHILDATAGLGRDAFVFASLGAEVTLLERNPVVYALLYDGLARAREFARLENESDLAAILQRMTLLQQQGSEFLTATDSRFDVIYLDPMFPERKKTALVKKEMRAFHEVVGADEDADNLLAPAMSRAVYRVVVKRPRLAGFLAQQVPSYQLEGKSSRFDIYALKALA